MSESIKTEFMSKTFLDKTNRINQKQLQNIKERKERIDIKIFHDKQTFTHKRISMKKELLFDYPLDDLKSLYHDINFYKEELVKDSENPVRVKLMGKAELKKKTDEFDAILNEIEEFAKEEGIDIKNDIVTLKTAQINKESLKQQMELFDKERTEDKEAENQNFVLMKDQSQQLLLLKRLDIINSKLDHLDNIIGLKEVFANESVFSKFQNNLYEIDLLDPDTIAHTIKKLELVTKELTRLAGDRKMNYFNQQQKEELKDFLGNFTELASSILENMIKEYEDVDNKHNVLKYTELLEDNSEILERLGKAVNQVNIYKNLLERYIQTTNDNHTILSALKGKIDSNKEILQTNLKSLQH